MMFIRKSLIRKLFLYFLLFGGVVAALAFTFYSLDYKTITIEVFLISLGVFILYFLLIYFFYVVRPLRVVLRQMEALLTGRSYKKIYTKRVDEIGVIAYFFNEVTKNLGSLAGNIKEQRRLSDELSLAAELQQNVLPKEIPSLPGLSIAIKSRPAAEIGGDCFDFINMREKTYMYVGDVTGHGVPAGLVMTMVHALLRVFSEMKSSAYEVVVETNKHLKQFIRANMFMTMLLLNWDINNKKMSYVGAGHEYLLIYRSKTGKCEKIPSGGIALGMVPDNSKLIKETEIILEENDTILVFSDGIVEAKTANGEMYEIDRLMESFVKAAAQYSDSIEIHKQIALDFSQFVGPTRQEDDITLMVIRRVPDELGNSSSTKWHEDGSRASQNPEIESKDAAGESPKTVSGTDKSPA